MNGTGPQADLAVRLHAVGIVPVVQLPSPELGLPLAEVLAAAGIPCLEITFRAGGAAHAIDAIRARRPDILVGAGTVLTIEQADAAIDAGAQFIVAPGTNPRVVAHVLGRGAPMIPGVATPSEIEANLERGVGLLKFFPAEAMGVRAAVVGFEDFADSRRELDRVAEAAGVKRLKLVDEDANCCFWG